MPNFQDNHKIISHFPNVAYNVVAIAASRGGLKAIGKILSALPVDFPAAIVVVQHLSSKYPSYTAQILAPHTLLRVKQAEEGELLRPRTVYTAVPDKHLVVKPDATLSLTDEPKVNFVRPAGDKLFVSVATSFKSRAIAIVLTGKDGDGTLGVLAIKKYGGTVIVQDRESSEYFNMPKSAIDTGKVDWVLPVDAIANYLVKEIMTRKVVEQIQQFSLQLVK
ncbi:chemotaxis protein CheB [Scytonema sp. NUACC26]|uniref:chemotaxis protein CheB n=1 Tax=Scytonema sp. NUACC26 TaxID=3140176 RepID=UPI0034DCBE07